MTQQIKIKGVADIVFLVDATGSMQPCIDAVKRNIQTFVESLTRKDANHNSPVKDWRAKVVGYRDWEYSDFPPFVDNPFVSSVPELERQLTALKADGGHDEPESLLEALYKVTTMSVTGASEPPRPNAWRPAGAARRFVIVFTDAPFKQPLREPDGATIDDVLNHLQESKIILHLFAPAGFEGFSTLQEVDKAEWHRIQVAPGSTPQKALEEFTTDQAKFQKIIEQLAKTITIVTAAPPVEEVV